MIETTTRTSTSDEVISTTIPPVSFLAVTTMTSRDDLDDSLNGIDSFIKEGDIWPAAVTTMVTIVIPHDDECLINTSRSDAVVLHTTTNTMLPSPMEVDDLDFSIDKENNYVTIDTYGATATIITQDDEVLIDTITKTTSDAVL